MSALVARLRALGPNARGALWAGAAVLAFTTMDSTVKWMGGSLHPLQIAFFRCAFALLATLPWLMLAGGRAAFRTRRPGAHLLRACFGYGAMACGFVALVQMNFADAVSLGYVRTLFLVPLAVFLLGETANWRRWAAIAVGFAGVLVMLRPGAGVFDPVALLALASGFFVACVSVSMKRLTETERPQAILFWFAVFASLLSFVPALFVWRWPAAHEWPVLMFMGVLGTVGQYFIVRAYRIADATAIDPIDYGRLVLVAILGLVVFGETLEWPTVAGSALIVLSTLYIAREQVMARRR
ncbi:MAG: DMT family transporter [Tagaea sp.]|nr:DMT family transporter [Tagaea sp.]